MKTLACMKKHSDGSHWGLSDLYPEIEKGIKAALKSGKKATWTTGWWSSKKEIVSGKITANGDGTLLVEASVSDDFDTEGRGEEKIPHTTDFKKVCSAIDKAWNKAEENRKENRVYDGYKILLTEKGHYSSWVETYILCLDPMYDTPPGDIYYQWGFQDEGDKLSKSLQDKIEKWIWKHAYGQTKEKKKTFGKYTVEPWID